MMLQILVNCLVAILIVIVPISVLWYILKYYNLQEWLYIPRRSKIAQIIQFGAFLLVLPMCYVLLYDFIVSLIISPADYYQLSVAAEQERFSSAGFIVMLNNILRNGVPVLIACLGIFIEFLQFWINNRWVNWVVENYPDHYKEILLEARTERKKWRTTHKTIEDFQAWVYDLNADKGWEQAVDTATG